MLKINQIYNECCLETLKNLDNNSVNCCITSPPYNMNLRIRNGKYCSRQITKELSTKYLNFNDNLDINLYNQFHSKVLSELLRVCDLIFYNVQIVTGSKRSVFKMIGDYSEYLKDIVIWDKGYAEPSIHKGVLNRRSELILIFTKQNSISREFKNCNFKKGELSDLWLIQKEKIQHEKHKAIFSKKLVKIIIENFTKKNDLIYDPFIGTGTTAVVAKSMDRHYIGSELIKEYVDIANQKILEQTCLPLFNNFKFEQKSLLK